MVAVAALLAFAAIADLPWHPDVQIRRAAGIVVGTLILWISEVAPLGIISLLIPVAASATGLLSWPQALAVWGDPTLFLFLGAFLLARALDKHGAFDWVASIRPRRSSAATTALVVLLLSGALSSVQNNTAVAAMLLPATMVLARATTNRAVVLLALSYGATFGGMATPVGTAPNFIGYAAMQKLDSSITFISWLRVGIPVWVGASLIGWFVLSMTRRFSGSVAGADDAQSAAAPDGNRGAAESALPARVPSAPMHDRRARIVAVAALALAATVWLTTGLIKSIDGTHAGFGSLSAGDVSTLAAWCERNLPDSLVPILVAGLLFLIPAGATRQPILDRRDFQSLDWDTLFLIAGGLCLGRTLEASGAAKALAEAVAATQLSPTLLLLTLGGATVLLSELTSNTATAALLVPIAGALGDAVGIAPAKTIWLVALCASLGFALPVSTPPNAIVYGTGMVPLRLMACAGLVVDALCLLWIVFCINVLA